MAYAGNDVVDILKSCLVPSCNEGNDRQLTKSDFKDYTSIIDDKLALVEESFDVSLFTKSSHMQHIEAVSYLLINCGQHSADSEWTTKASVAFFKDKCHKTLTAFEQSHKLPIFCKTSILKKIFIFLRPHLLSTTFKCNPASVICYKWLLQQIKSPQLGDYLPDVLPTALIISDDFETHNIKMGFECLNHIIDNVAFEQLRWYAQDEVVIDALKKCLYRNEPDIIDCQLECYTSLMKKSRGNSSTLERNHFDGVVKDILFNMYLERKLDVRRIYVSHLPNMIEARGLGVVRHLTMIFKVLAEYCLEPTTTTLSLEALSKIVQTCWCRGKVVGENVLIILLKVLVETAHNPSKYNINEVVSSARQVIPCLQLSFPEIVNEFMENLSNDSSVEKEVINLVHQVFE